MLQEAKQKQESRTQTAQEEQESGGTKVAFFAFFDKKMKII